MSIESPATYGEHYWKSQIDASLSFEEEIEKSVQGYIPSIFTDPEIRAAVPFDILPKLESMFEFKHPGLGAIAGRFVSEIADSAVSSVLNPFLKPLSYSANAVAKMEFIPLNQAADLFRRKRIGPEFIGPRFRRMGFREEEERNFIQATSAFPTIPELIRWGRYFGGEENTKDVVDAVFQIDDADWKIWLWLTQQVYTTDQVTSMFHRGRITDIEADAMLGQIGWADDSPAVIRDLSYLIPNAMILMQGDLQAELTVEEIFDDLGRADIHPDYQQKYVDAVLTKPASLDVISYHLRQENDLRDLDRDLRRIGIHPNYFEMYRTLAYRIPPVADIITMAVREAFTPSVAARFGQYEDFPPDFARYAAQQGLTEDWAKRYWAAHWGLPSPQQGFEMLHRGVIDEGDLTLLMKAQDIMPFWRDKMTAIAYRPLSRVDVRRMYKEGILDEKGVFSAYLDAGYSDENAQNMTEFTIAFVLSQQSKFTSADILRAYTDRMIDHDEAYNLLMMLGVKGADVSYILTTADYKREWALTDQKIKGVRNLYKRGVHDENSARGELLQLDLPAEQVESLMEQWYYEVKEEVGPTWTKAETFRFCTQGLIDRDRVKQELTIMGYDEEHITIYMETLPSKPEIEL